MEPPDKAPGSDHDEIELILGEDSEPLIPEGKYQVVYHSHQKRRQFGSIKLYLRLEIVDGKYTGISVFRAYNFYDGKRSRCDLTKDLLFLSGLRGSKKSSLPLSLFKNKVLEVEVRTVTHDSKQRKLPKNMQYSVVDRIVQVLTGTGSERWE